jgi:ubiquinone/menaquinone biosynthesis C-methylase UbiE
MSSRGNPFTDPAQIRGPLYGTAGRLAARTTALHRARVSGRHAAGVIAGLAASHARLEPAVIADVGCGRGTTSRALAAAFPAALITAIDLSAALLTAARDLQPRPGTASPVQADFHHLPLAGRSCDLITAAFCLYHSAAPASVLAEIGRCLTPAGTVIIAVKSAGSYRQLDQLIAASGLDPAAETRPSLYQAAHSGNITALATSAGLSVRQVLHETHRFTFPDLADAAAYLATSPRYELPPGLGASPAALAAALRERVGEQPVTATSVVTYLVAAHPA